MMKAYIQILMLMICQAGSVAKGKVYSMYCLTMAIAQILLWVSRLYDTSAQEKEKSFD